tara:strand:+ start:79 stop:510 length:432 start_codon:yes stop_codon:yes gene_type:complete
MFFNKVACCSNTGKVELKFIKIEQGDDFSDFTGDNERTIEKDITLGCLYRRNISDKVREEVGVDQNVTDIVYISPLELKRKYGSMEFPDYIRNSYSQFAVKFLGKHYEVVQIRELEPMELGGKMMCIAYMITLNRDKGNRDIN